MKKFSGGSQPAKGDAGLSGKHLARREAAIALLMDRSGAAAPAGAQKIQAIIFGCIPQ
jgi:hypothetical protein